MKHNELTRAFLVSLIFMTLSLGGHAQTNPRKMLWLNGPSPTTSNQWIRAKVSAQLAGYQMAQVNDWPYNNNNIANDIPGWASFFNQKLTDEGHNNVLGIGHDAGGLILRYMGMNQQDGRLSALILDGVPNQGAGIMNHLLTTTSDKSNAQNTIENLLNLRTQAQGCNGCRMLEAAQSWFNVFANSNNKAYYEQLKPGSPTIANLATPNIPYAVIWGNEDEDDALTLTRLVGSRYNSGLFGEDNEYVDCYRKELEQRLQAAATQSLLSFMKSVSILAQAASKIKIDPKEPFAGVAGTISAAIDATIEQIRGLTNLATEVREMFECELIHQALNAKWNLMVSQYSVTPVVTTVMVPSDCISCENCYDDPDQQVVGYCLSVCDLDCPPLMPVPITTFFYTIDPHDGLLTREEQLLSGAAKPYEARKCNHFQEQFWQNQPIADAFNDLFMGGAGAAFVVPK